MKKITMIGLGCLTTGLWLWALVIFLGLKDVLNGVVIGYIVLGWSIPACLFAVAFDDKTDTGYTNHKCNLCKSPIKIGEGMHFPRTEGDDNCYCVCPKCLPNVTSPKAI